MRIVVTGGGTGGHVFPALELARTCRDTGMDVLYLGSLRGQEGRLCKEHNFDFAGFPTGPLYSLKSIQGWKAAANIVRSTAMAKRALAAFRPEVVFSTGGYSSAPVVSAAKSMGIPYVIHEQNTVPGRTNRVLGKNAYAIATTFKTGGENFENPRVIRTGMPIRSELKEGMQGRLGFNTKAPSDRPMIFVMGGSQGAMSLNEAALATAIRMVGTRAHWLIAAGPKNYDAMLGSLKKLAVSEDIQIRAFLGPEEMAEAYSRAEVVVCRSGGSLAEVAAFRKPSVLVPLPTSFANHQLHNAEEFSKMGAAMLLPQSEMSPASLEVRIAAWLNDSDAYKGAQAALAEWDIPDASDRVLAILNDAAKSGR